MPAWILIVTGGGACMAVLALLSFAIGAKRYEGQHVLADPQEEWDAWMAENERGSMILAEEHPLDPLPAPVVDAHPWLDRTLADLAPEALDEPDEIVLPAYGGWISGPCLDPGLGDAAVEPPASPGPGQCSEWLAEQLAVLRAWSEWQQQKMALAWR